MSDPIESAPAPRPASPEEAAEQLDAHVRATVAWHFSPETGTPFWIDRARDLGLDAVAEITTFADLAKLPRFDGEWLRSEPHSRFVPRAFEGRPYTIFETGGTTGMPKQRIGWDDYKIDYAAFSSTLDDDAFPPGGAWLMIGPTGPRRLRLAIEFLANHRGSPCYFVDLDPRWVKRLIRERQFDQAKAYMEHVLDQAEQILKHRDVTALFTTPKLLEALGERLSIPEAGIRGVFCGGTEMAPQNVRFLCEEVLEGEVTFVPTYGNTLMGLAEHEKDFASNGYSITYHAPQPRAVVRVVRPDDPDSLVEYDEWGRAELTTLTRELLLPRFLERDEAIRRRPTATHPWDGAGEVRPFRAHEEQIVEGVY